MEYEYQDVLWNISVVLIRSLFQKRSFLKLLKERLFLKVVKMAGQPESTWHSPNIGVFSIIASRLEAIGKYFVLRSVSKSTIDSIIYLNLH